MLVQLPVSTAMAVAAVSVATGFYTCLLLQPQPHPQSRSGEMRTSFSMQGDGDRYGRVFATAWRLERGLKHDFGPDRFSYNLYFLAYYFS